MKPNLKTPVSAIPSISSSQSWVSSNIRTMLLGLLIRTSVFVLNAMLVATCSIAQAQNWTGNRDLPTVSLALTSAGEGVSSVASGSVLTLTATVTIGGVPLKRGSVEFCDSSAAYCTDIYLLGKAQLTDAGKAVLKLTPGIGTHSYKAIFVANATALSSTSSESSLSVIGRYLTTTTIGQSGSVGNYSLTATVVGTGTLDAYPGGQVSFLDTTMNDSLLATATLGIGTPSLSFVNSGDMAVFARPQALAVGDLNGDGKEDLVVSNTENSTLSVLLGNGDGSFTLAQTPTTGAYPSEVAMGDFNGDGIPDLAVVNALQNQGSVTILLGNGDGTFRTVSATPATGRNPCDIAVGDFNGDGMQDLAIANQNSNTLTILMGNGDGTFTLAPKLSSGAFPANQIAVGDFNGDGRPDLIIGTHIGAAILLGNGDGTFRAAESPAAGFEVQGIAVGDFNCDGIPDLAISNLANNTVAILLGNGDATFSPAATLAAGGSPQGITVVDLNADGKPDLAVTNIGANNITILMGNGDGSFTPNKISPATGLYPQTIASGHFKADGSASMVTANISDNSVTIVSAKMTQTATATANGISPLGAVVHQVEADYPGDSVFGASTSGTTGLLGTAETPSLTLMTSLSPSTFGQSITFTCGATFKDKPVLDGTTLMFSVDGQTSYVEASRSVNGFATWTMSSLAVGSHGIGCSIGDSNYNSVETGIVQVVNKAHLLSLVVTSSANPSTIGDNVTLTIRASGVTAVPTGTVTLSLNSVVLGVQQLNTSGVAVYSSSTLAVGSDVLTVTYSGDSSYN